MTTAPQSFSSATATTDLGDHSRFTRIGFLAIALSFGGFGGWAALAPIDSAAIAPAQVAVDTSKKPLQHWEGGIVREILIKENERVAEGQVLFRLEPTAARANAGTVRMQLDAALAAEARLIAEQARLPRITFPDLLLARRHNPEVAGGMADQERQFDERRRSIEGQVRIFEARSEQTTRDVTGKTAQAESLKGQIASLTAEYAKVTPLVERGFYPVNKRLAMERDLIRLKGELGQAEAEIARGAEIIREARLQIDQVTQKFQEDVAQQMGEARGRLSDTREKLAIADDVLTRVEIRAPRAGIVQGVKVFAAGTVVRSGETIAELVPVEDALVMSARVSPLDIDSVAKGQKATVRFPAFASRTTSPVLGQVQSISADTLIDEATKQPYYLARVVVDLKTLPEALSARIVPGMPADVMIATGERTMLRYLLGPLMDNLGRGFREK